MTAFLAGSGQVITATAGDTVGSSDPFTVLPGALDSLVVEVPEDEGEPLDQTAGVAFAVDVTAYDAWLNVKTDGEGDGDITLSGLDPAPDTTDPNYGGSGTDGATVTLSDGEATTQVTAVDATTDPLPDAPTSITADVESIQGTSDPFTVLPGHAAELVVNDIPNHELGTSIGATVRTVDQYGNFGAPTQGATTIELTMYVKTPSYTGPTRITRTLAATNSPSNPEVLFAGIVYPVKENSIVAKARSIVGDALTAGLTKPFDVLEKLVSGASSDTLKSTGANSNLACTDTTPQDNTCITWKLPSGLNFSFYVEEGACKINPTDNCVGSMAGLFPDVFSGTQDPSDEQGLFTDLYTPTHFVTLIIELDKSVLKASSGPNGVKKVDWEIQAATSNVFVPVPQCAKKNVVGPGKWCINKANKNGSGDLVTEIIMYDDDLLARGR